MELPAALGDLSEVSVEQLVSTGGADLPARIVSAYTALADDAASAEESAALRAEGLASAARVTSEVEDAFALATSRIYSLTALVLVLAAALSLRIPELPLRTTHDRAAVLAPPALEGP
jgi:hypothetical protein